MALDLLAWAALVTAGAAAVLLLLWLYRYATRGYWWPWKCRVHRNRHRWNYDVHPAFRRCTRCYRIERRPA